MRVLVIGSGAREHALAWCLASSGADVVALSAHANPGLGRVAKELVLGDPSSPEEATRVATSRSVAYAVIGPEAPLGAGVSDALRTSGIPVVGPSKAAARIETSKAYCRDFLARHEIPGSPRYAAAKTLEEVDAAVAGFTGPFVVKPIGLTGGKGVWVQGRDFPTPEEGALYAKRLITTGGSGVVLEERLDGEEFSLMAFVTDSGIYPMPAVLDYKRALENDGGPNTGGMGSFSQRDHLLPFLSKEMYERALDILQKAVEGVLADGMGYRGILYGGFMLTANGPYLVEFNARFGDPEALNVLSLYENGNFAELLNGVAHGKVDRTLVRFRLRSSVVKYLVPPGYGFASRPGSFVTLDEEKIEAAGARVFFADSEAAGPARFRLGTSRGIALVGEASAIHEASARVEAALGYVVGDFSVRHDIGTAADVTKRTEHMRSLIAPGAKPSPLPLSVAAADAPPSSAADPSMLI
ncbi:MAG: phosphoribosylamine--glycine ligase [Thermoplasmata archaeon]|nr:phosphoribosylamine--glycine ligase [Thermoplasmata archaeon]